MDKISALLAAHGGMTIVVWNAAALVESVESMNPKMDKLVEDLLKKTSKDISDDVNVKWLLSSRINSNPVSQRATPGRWSVAP